MCFIIERYKNIFHRWINFYLCLDILVFRWWEEVKPMVQVLSRKCLFLLRGTQATILIYYNINLLSNKPGKQFIRISLLSKELLSTKYVLGFFNQVKFFFSFLFSTPIIARRKALQVIMFHYVSDFYAILYLF